MDNLVNHLIEEGQLPSGFSAQTVFDDPAVADDVFLRYMKLNNLASTAFKVDRPEPAAPAAAAPAASGEEELPAEITKGTVIRRATPESELRRIGLVRPEPAEPEPFGPEPFVGPAPEAGRPRAETDNLFAEAPGETPVQELTQRFEQLSPQQMAAVEAAVDEKVRSIDEVSDILRDDRRLDFQERQEIRAILRSIEEAGERFGEFDTLTREDRRVRGQAAMREPGLELLRRMVGSRPRERASLTRRR